MVAPKFALTASLVLGTALLLGGWQPSETGGAPIRPRAHPSTPSPAPTASANVPVAIAPTPPPAPGRMAPPVFSVPTGMLFTFDDCEARPGQGTTASYITVLKAHHVTRAIFFLTGICYKTRPDIVRMVRDAGYTIGNHTLTHADLTRLSGSGIDAELEGGPASTVFRPPYGAHNSTVDARVAAHHLQEIMWSASGGDSGAGVARTCDRILEDLLNTIKPGSIVLLHLFNTKSPLALDAYLSGRQSCRA
jgi:peptidoglycan/xylan/chitin deacetylase (PgdA/CDA1 family)